MTTTTTNGIMGGDIRALVHQYIVEDLRVPEIMTYEQLVRRQSPLAQHARVLRELVTRRFRIMQRSVVNVEDLIGDLQAVAARTRIGRTTAVVHPEPLLNSVRTEWEVTVLEEVVAQLAAALIDAGRQLGWVATEQDSRHLVASDGVQYGPFPAPADDKQAALLAATRDNLPGVTSIRFADDFPDDEPRCPSCGEPWSLLRSGAVGHSGDASGNDCPTEEPAK